MACEDPEVALNALVEALSGPAMVQSDAGTVEAHRLDRLVQAARYLDSRCAASSRAFPLRRIQLKFPSAV